MLEDADSVVVKSALQHACNLYESGQAFVDPSFLSAALARYIRSDDIKVRRWSYKLAGRLRDVSLLPLLLEAVDLEAIVDAENRSWAVAAYLGYAPVTARQTLIRRLGEEFHESALELASRFFSIGDPEPYKSTLRLRHLEQDPLSRKWLSMLAGYAAVEPLTIHREFADLDLVRDIIFDTDPENVEYSIWAEHRHPDGSHKHLRAKPQDLLEHENVRRWLIQLCTKTEKAALSHRELVLSRMDHRYEPSALVREGLASGIRRLPLRSLVRDTLDWYEAEGSPAVKLALVDHLATRAKHGDHLARSKLQADYAELDSEHLRALKIESVSDSAWLGGIRSRRAPQAHHAPSIGVTNRSQQPMLQFFQPGVVVMVDDKSITQSGTGNAITGVNMGQMIESTMNALSQSRDHGLAAAVPQLETFVRSLGEEPIKNHEKRGGAELVREAIEAPNDDARTSALAKLKSFASALLVAPGVSQKFIEDGHKLVDTINALLP